MEIDFKGTGVAMVTPFNEDKTLDYIGLSNLIEYLIDGGVGSSFYGYNRRENCFN